jgi:hypothetical protein
VAVARHQGIAIAGGRRPGAGDAGLAARRVGLVPGGDVGFDRGIGDAVLASKTIYLWLLLLALYSRHVWYFGRCSARTPTWS